MTEVEIANGYLRVVVEGFDKVLALKSSVEVPLAHVLGASQDPDALRERHGLRLGGTSLPGVVAAGTFFDGRWWFLDVHHPERSVKIELDHEHYAALIVEVENPRGDRGCDQRGRRGSGIEPTCSLSSHIGPRELLRETPPSRAMAWRPAPGVAC